MVRTIYTGILIFLWNITNITLSGNKCNVYIKKRGSVYEKNVEYTWNSSYYGSR